MQQRLQKVMANAGIASRRACERIIEEKRVRVNGKIAELGCKVDLKDRITVDGKPMTKRKQAQLPRVIMYNKPEGEISTRDDPQDRKTVFSALPRIKNERWISIGRLDINTSGLLLFTTDGELAHRLMHPRYEIKRKYAVRVLGEVTPEIIRKLKRGIELEDGKGRFLTIEDVGGRGANHWYYVTLAEGRNREVRRLWEAVGLTVSRLKRIAFAGIALPSIVRSGRYQELTNAELKTLYTLADLPFGSKTD
jgi:23S rRNA pseudouridine2605 synthase